MKESKFEKSLDILEEKKKDLLHRSLLQILSERLLDQEKLMRHPEGTYDVYDEGSRCLGDTLGLIFSYGVNKEMSRKVTECFSRKIYDPETSKKLRKLQPLKGLSILDIGSGKEGRFVRFLRELGADARGLDVQKPEKDDNIILQGDITEPKSLSKEIKDRKFDLVVSTMTFVPEVVNFKENISNALELLKDGGYFISTPGASVDLLPDDIEQQGFKDLRKEQCPFDWPTNDLRREINDIVIYKETKKV